MSQPTNNRKKGIPFFGSVGTLIDAVRSQYSATATFQMGGRAVTQPELLAALQAEYALEGNVASARTALKTAVAGRRAGLAEARRTYRAAVAAIRADKGPDSPDLHVFGIVPYTPHAPLTSAQRVIAQAKSAATRRARGTVGKRQRESITVGGQPGVVVISPAGNPVTVQNSTAPAEPGAAPHPAASAPAAQPSSPGSGTASGSNGH